MNYLLDEDPEVSQSFSVALLLLKVPWPKQVGREATLQEIVVDGRKLLLVDCVFPAAHVFWATQVETRQVKKQYEQL